MKSEDLLKIIKSSGAKVINESSFGDLINGTTSIDRDIKFECNGIEYSATWYCNLCTLYLCGLIIQFDDLLVMNTFPVRSKNQIHFYKNKERVAVLVIPHSEGDNVS